VGHSGIRYSLLLPAVLLVAVAAAPAEDIRQEAFARAKAEIRRAVQEGQVAGAAHLVGRDGKTLYCEVAGFSDVEGKTPLKPDSIVRIYSMSKPITTVAAMILCEQGKFNLDDPVARFIPAFSNAKVIAQVGDTAQRVAPRRPISIRDVLRHTTGYSYGEEPSVRDAYQREGLRYRGPAGMFPPRMNIEKAAQSLARIPALHHPGERFTYGFSTDLLGRLIEVWSGKPLDAFLRQSVLEPLEMTDTDFSVPKEKRSRFTSCHTLRDGKFVVVDEASASPFNEGFEFHSGGGGLVSTIRDYANFCQMLVDGGRFKGRRLLKEGTIRQMFTDQLHGVAGPFRFGLGFAISEVALGSGKSRRKATQYSWGGYASTDFRLVPSERLFQIVARQQVPDTHDLADRLCATVYSGVTASADASADGKWSRFGELPVPLIGPAARVVSGRLVVAGGAPRKFDPLSSVSANGGSLKTDLNIAKIKSARPEIAALLDEKVTKIGTSRVKSTGFRGSYFVNGEIHVNAYGTPEGKPLTTGHQDFKPSWSKTGDRLVFFRRLKDDPVVTNWITAMCIINVDGTGFHKLSDGTHTDFNPTWTRDGTNTPIWNRKNPETGGFYVVQSKVGNVPGREVAVTDKRYHTWVYSCVKDGRILVKSVHPKQGYGYFLMTRNVGGEPRFERIDCDLATKGILDRVSVSPSEKLNVACIGVGGKGFDNVRNVSTENIVALCDVDKKRAADAFELFPQAKRYGDFRRMLDQEGKNTDAVVVTTPDHVHIPASVMAMKLGKHVYCEKPLGQNIHEIRVATEVARKSRVATQMGNGAHSGNSYRSVVALIKAGTIGEVKEVHAWCDDDKGTPPDDGRLPWGDRQPRETPPVPEHLHWDLWLSPAPYRPYNPAYHPLHWRGWWDFGNGKLGDMGCHMIDLPFSALDLKYPLTVEAEGPRRCSWEMLLIAPARNSSGIRRTSRPLTVRRRTSSSDASTAKVGPCSSVHSPKMNRNRPL